MSKEPISRSDPQPVPRSDFAHLREPVRDVPHKEVDHPLTAEQRKALATPELVTALNAAMEALAAPAPNDVATEKYRSAAVCLADLVAKITPEPPKVP